MQSKKLNLCIDTSLETKTEKQKDFDAVKFMRQVRDEISKETQGMDFKQLKNTIYITDVFDCRQNPEKMKR